MDVIDEEDDWNSVSGEDDGDTQGCDETVVILQTSAPGVSAKSILLLPERNEDNTDVCVFLLPLEKSLDFISVWSIL